MNDEARGEQTVLGPGFAHRVVERVRTARRRRRLYRWALTSAMSCALAGAAIFYLAGPNPAPPHSAQAARGNDAVPEQIAAHAGFSASPVENSPSFAQPLAFFFPGATAVADIDSSEANYWHSYDSWWTTNP